MTPISGGINAGASVEGEGDATKGASISSSNSGFATTPTAKAISSPDETRLNVPSGIAFPSCTDMASSSFRFASSAEIFPPRLLAVSIMVSQSDGSIQPDTSALSS
jgi:hypothetical protein